MSLIADALKPSLVGRVISMVGRPEAITLPDTIVSRRAAYVVTFDAATESVTLDFRDSELITNATASDCNRLVSAAYQSVRTTPDALEDKDSFPWGLIRLYYAAFYAAHATLRLLGQSYCHFESRHAGQIIRIADASGNPIPFHLGAGMYRCEVLNEATMLRCTRAAANSQGGSHEAFWTYLEARVREASDAILAGPLSRGDAQAVAGKLESFKRLLAHSSAFGWLSKTRNDLQYRQAHSAWFQCGISKADRKSIARLASLWEADPMSIDLDNAALGSLGRFARASAFQIAVCRSLVQHVSTRQRSPRSFFAFGPANYLSQAAQ